jgi:hypothetical protein
MGAEVKIVRVEVVRRRLTERAVSAVRDAGSVTPVTLIATWS